MPRHNGLDVGQLCKRPGEEYYSAPRAYWPAPDLLIVPQVDHDPDSRASQPDDEEAENLRLQIDAATKAIKRQKHNGQEGEREYR